MKVLLINNCHWPRGGSESVYFNTAKLLIEHGHEVVFLSFADEHNIHTEQPEYFVKYEGGLGKIKSYFCNGESVRVLEEVLDKEKPDIAHAHLFWGGMTAAIIPVLHMNGVPLVHTAHDYRMVCPAYLLKDGKGQLCERCKGGKFVNCLRYRCSKGSLVQSAIMTAEMYYRNHKWHPAKEIDGIIFVSNFSKQKHVEFDRRFTESYTMVLYNTPGEKVKESLDKSVNTFNSYYLFYGRLSVEKGISTLLKSIEKYPQLPLKIVGTGPLEEELKNFCCEKGLINVEFLGYKSGKELFDLVAGAKYVCAPSECYENNPMTIVEAYSLATPVIGAAIGGISEIIKEGETGFLFESGAISSLENAIEKSLAVSENEYSLIKKNAYQFAKANFDSEKYYEMLVGFYQNVIKKFNSSKD